MQINLCYKSKMSDGPGALGKPEEKATQRTPTSIPRLFRSKVSRTLALVKDN